MSVVTTRNTRTCDSVVSSCDSFYKDGRKISVGDCALFEPPQNRLPFIGIVHCLSNKKDEDNNLVLGVSWLYRLSELELGKGVLVDAEPNEIFYSFHKDEIPAASVLHPCKVAFLPKDVQLSPRVSSFICRQVYDIANSSLWWLTDRDFIDERQEEVDKLLYKTRIEMHPTVQPGGRSPKPLSVNTSSASQLKPATDNVQSSSTSYSPQVKRKKREHRDHGSEPSKTERSSKSVDSESAKLKSETLLKSEIAKITEKGGLVNVEGVEKLVQLMQPNSEEMNMDLYKRSLLAGVIASTDRFDCLSWFVQLKGLPVLDEWLQDIHQGRIGDRKNGGAEQFLLVLLRALDKLPVNLQALQMCNIGRSVNHLRTNKNADIQKKARNLVDTWKKRVEAEMNSIDSKKVSTKPVSWSSKPRQPEVSHPGNRLPVGSTGAAVKSPVTQLSTSKTSSSPKPITNPNTKSASSSPRPLKETGKDGQFPKISPSVTKEERSSSSSQSHNCSQSFSGKDDARSSTAGSISVSKTKPQHQKVISGIPRDTGSSRTSSKAVVPVVEGNSRKLIVKIPNRTRSPAQCGSEDRRDSGAVHLEKQDQLVTNSKEESDVNEDYFQSEEFKALLNGCDEGGESPTRDEEKSKVIDDARESSVVESSVVCKAGSMSIAKLNDASFSSMKALIESCAKVSETNTSLSSADDIGIKLLASVAAEEDIIMSDHDSPTHSPHRNTSSVPEKSESSPRNVLARTAIQQESCSGNDNGDRNFLSKEPAAHNSCSTDLQPNTESVIKTSEKLEDSEGAPASISNKRDIGDQPVTKDINVDSSQTDIKPMRKIPMLVKDEKPAIEVSPSSNLLGTEGVMTVNERYKTGYLKQKMEHTQETGGKMLPSPSSVRKLGPEFADKSEEPGMKSPHAQAIVKVDSDALKDHANKALVGSNSTNRNQKTENLEEKLGKHVLPGSAEPCGRSKKLKVTGVEVEERAETAVAPLLSASGPDTKAMFDLNKGFFADDVDTAPPVSSPVSASAKRSFLGELGWKGSAATSAFRPAEPRKIQEASSKHNRPVLDFDLNAPADEAADDIGLGINCGGAVSPARVSGGGLDLDLNQADETIDTEHQQYSTNGSINNNRCLEFPLVPAKAPQSSSTGGFSRDFDLNNGPTAFEDTSVDPLYKRHKVGNIQQSQPAMRMNNVEMPSWFAPGNNNNGPPVVVLNRGGEKHFPGVLPQRISGGGTHFSSDVYWGSVLPSSSSPGVPFQYPVFPFGANFPLSSSSGGAYIDASSGGRICFPTMQGPPRPYMISNAFVEANNNSISGGGGVMDNNRKWSNNSRQGGLDLNAGPDSEDVYAQQRHFSFLTSQAMKEEQARILAAAAAAGGVMKRKEPEGSWEMDGFRYKQSSRQ
jgi:hypothetical protein